VTLRLIAPLLLAPLLAALAPPAPLLAQHEPSVPLRTSSLAGQSVAVLPLTMVVMDDAIADDSAYAPLHDRGRTLRWADSLIGDAMTSRAPEVKWVLPGELRKASRRSGGFIADPDQMGQAVMRSKSIKRVPDPLRSNLRTLVAIAGGRYALIPAALAFSRDTAGAVHADLSLAFADARTGQVMWHSTAAGSGAAPLNAVRAALATVLVDQP
jgi:hypothetical protein